MDPYLLYSLAATLIRRYGDDLLRGGDEVADAIIDKGTDAVATAAVGSLIGWLKSRGRANELERAAGTAIAKPDDEEALAALSKTIESVTGGATAELAALVAAAERAASIEVESIRFGGVRAGVYVEGGGVAHIERVDVDMS